MIITLLKLDKLLRNRQELLAEVVIDCRLRLDLAINFILIHDFICIYLPESLKYKA